jgi:hypothetical protein
MSEIRSKPFVFDKGGFRNSSQTIVIDFNELVRARCGKLYSYEKIKNEIIPFEIKRAKENDAKPLFDSLDALINNPALVPYNDKKSEKLILCNNFEQEIDGDWEVTLLGNTDNLAMALDKLSKGEKANLVSMLILRNGDKFAWIPQSIDISRHTFYEQQSVSPAANEVAKVVDAGVSNQGGLGITPNFRNVRERNSWIVYMKGTGVAGYEIIRRWNAVNPNKTINENTLKNAKRSMTNQRQEITREVVQTSPFNRVIVIDGKRAKK